MSGENVSEPAVRSVFASAIDYVVHLNLDEREADDARGELRRQVLEILAVVDPGGDAVLVGDQWSAAHPV